MKLNSLWRAALLGTAIVALVSCQSPSSAGSSGADSSDPGPAATFGDHDAIQGTWSRTVRGEKTVGGTSVQYDYIQTWTIGAGTWEQVVTYDYDNGDPDETKYTKGTITYRDSDGTMVLVQTEAMDANGQWVSQAAPGDTVVRNLIVGDVWHQSTWHRISSGSFTSLAGTWEGLPLTPTTKAHYTFTPQNAAGGEILYESYAMGADGVVVGAPTFSATDVYTWTGTRIGLTGNTTDLVMIANGHADFNNYSGFANFTKQP